ncbi:MAG: glycoside hydrolase family 32 protein [Clostridia bacterium]|nr:glycoside hydrolase family 32 protein [Clostridia bacterium]
MNADNPLYPNLYREALRPQYHFSSRRGWLNDPNGLVYDGERFHLYYQHNPYGILHGGVNIHWGHAVSADGIRWTEHSDGIRPWICTRHIASGSCVIDEEGVAGYGKGAIIAAFTHLGSVNFRTQTHETHPSEGQFLAWSKDGERFTLFPEQPAIPTEAGKSWRDPRIFRDPEDGFGIAVYETTDKGNCVSFYHSDNLHTWSRTSRAEDLYECPDLFPLTPANGGAPKWVLYGADGLYRIGEFTHGAFREEGERFPLDYGLCTYAGQTWNGVGGTDARMHISWLRDDKLSWTDPTSYPDMPFSQQMTVPCLLKLVESPNGYRLTRTPIPALNDLRTGDPETRCLESVNDAVLELPTQGDALINIQSEAPFTLELGIATIEYDPESGCVNFDRGNKRVKLMRSGALLLRLLTDTMSSEFFLQNEISASYGQEIAGKILRVTGQNLRIEAEIYHMDSIWN